MAKDYCNGELAVSSYEPAACPDCDDSGTWEGGAAVEPCLTCNSPAARLEYLRGQIQAERISTMEILELQSLAEYIEPGDVELLQWANVPEGVDPRVWAGKAPPRPEAYNILLAECDYYLSPDGGYDADGDELPDEDKVCSRAELQAALNVLTAAPAMFEALEIANDAISSLSDASWDDEDERSKLAVEAGEPISSALAAARGETKPPRADINKVLRAYLLDIASMNPNVADMPDGDSDETLQNRIYEAREIAEKLGWGYETPEDEQKDDEDE